MSKKLKIGLIISIFLVLALGFGLALNKPAKAQAYSENYCTPGETKSCTTTNGYSGTQTCLRNLDYSETGHWGECIQNQIIPTPTLNIAKLDTPDPVAAGANLTYTLNFAITGADATGVVMTDVIPTNTSFVSASDPGKYDTLTNTVTWNFSNLAKGNYVVVLKVLVYSPLANGTKIANTATVDTDQTDPLSASSETTVSTAPILTMTKLVDKATGNAGDTLLYTVKVTNSGTDTAKAVKLTDTLPAGFTFVDNGTATMTYSFGDIEPGKTVATSYSVKIDASVVAGTYTNTATLTAANHANLSAVKSIDIKTPVVLGVETEQPAPVQEIKVLGAEEELPVTGAPLIGTILISLVSSAGITYLIRKKIF